MKGHQYRWLAGGHELKQDRFRCGLHGGYLVDSAFVVQ